ncbi:hypothetical protein TMatcc_003161 [Talaromyces marneffei ATCC 18224]
MYFLFTYTSPNQKALQFVGLPAILAQLWLANLKQPPWIQDSLLHELIFVPEQSLPSAIAFATLDVVRAH